MALVVRASTELLFFATRRDIPRAMRTSEPRL
jgi:hypothetical protein